VIPFAHVGGLPIEETLALYGPGLLLAFGGVTATVRARLRQVTRRRGARRRGRPTAGG
jgi:hypothetical protein